MLLNGGPIFFPIFHRVGLHLVLLQEAVEFVAGFHPEQGTELKAERFRW